jgi:hypothetical protein
VETLPKRLRKGQEPAHTPTRRALCAVPIPRRPDPFWPIAFAAMAVAVRTGSKDLAEQVGRLFAARPTVFQYECILTNVGREVGMRDALRAYFGDESDPLAKGGA